MHRFAFRTSCPVSAVSRALDELVRAGFTLRSLDVEADASTARVLIGFDGEGTVAPEAYTARLNRMPFIVPCVVPCEETCP